MGFKRSEGYLILGMYLVAGVFLGYSIGRERLIRKPNSVVVDIVKEDDEILIYEHYTEELVFEYNKNKEVDKSAYREFKEVWTEAKDY